MGHVSQHSAPKPPRKGVNDGRGGKMHLKDDLC